MMYIERQGQVYTTDFVIQMSARHTVHSPLGERYASQAMLELWSPRTRHGLWRRLWLALAEAERELGVADSRTRRSRRCARISTTSTSMPSRRTSDASGTT